MGIPVRLKFSLRLPLPFTGKIQTLHKQHNLALQQKQFPYSINRNNFLSVRNRKNQLILKHESCFYTNLFNNTSAATK